MADSNTTLLQMGQAVQAKLEQALQYVQVSHQDVQSALTELNQMLKLMSAGPVTSSAPAAPVQKK